MDRILKFPRATNTILHKNIGYAHLSSIEVDGLLYVDYKVQIANN